MPMRKVKRALSCLAVCAAFFAGGLLVAQPALADKIILKDGRVLEGKVVKQGADFVIFKIKVGSIEQDKIFDRKEVVKVELDNPAPKAGDAAAKPADSDAKSQANPDAKSDAKPDAKPDAKADRHTGATRVAILNFGAPSSWQGKYGADVGIHINVGSFKAAIPLLEKAKAEIVVIRINSGGGSLNEARMFTDLFEKQYKPRFRTVMWVESAISAAAMSPWPLEEVYFLPQGNMGACTGWFGNLTAVKGAQLEDILFWMEKTSALGKKDKCIMRSMQIMEPLSVDVDENGEVHWRQDEQGEVVLNKTGDIYTMTASEAMKFKFAKGVAADKEELTKAMGLQEVEWVAQDATDLVDKSIRDNDAVEKHNDAVFQKYQLAIGMAQQLPDKKRRGIELAAARRYLAELRKMVAVNPNFGPKLGIPPEWFDAQEELIRKLAALP